MTLSITEHSINEQHLETQNNDTRQNDTQHKDIRHCGTQHKNIQYNSDDQHKRWPAQCYAVSQFLLCCAVILSVIMLIVVAPIFDIFCVEIVDATTLSITTFNLTTPSMPDYTAKISITYLTVMHYHYDILSVVVQIVNMLKVEAL
jgi:hypothetical protein